MIDRLTKWGFINRFQIDKTKIWDGRAYYYSLPERWGPFGPFLSLALPPFRGIGRSSPPSNRINVLAAIGEH
jgi:hypothetical protein